MSEQEIVSAKLAAGDTDPPLDDRRIAKTGDRCEIPGLYEAECRHRERKLVRQGEAFPACMACRKVVFWNLVKSMW